MDKPRILVIYFSQTGQLRRILDSIVSPMGESCEVTFAPIVPVREWSFPWKSGAFFDAMPESVVGDPAPVHPLDAAVTSRKYDMVILGWQPWFLHLSQPIAAFLQSEDARILDGLPVVTVTGCRNMWLNACEQLKHYLWTLGASHVGNIVMTDSHANLVSLVTIIRWLMHGQKRATRWLPEAGVSTKDVAAAFRFGAPVAAAANGQPAFALQTRLLELGAIRLDPALVLLERRALRKFRFWARHIREKGRAGDASRRARVAAFRRLLLVGVTVLSPLSALMTLARGLFMRKRLRKDAGYFSGVEFEPGRI